MKAIRKAMRWLEKNSQSLGKKYKNQWLAIGPKGVAKHSTSYVQAAEAVRGRPEFLLIRVPKNPRSAFFY